jgi:hypothetical protein
MNRTIIAVASFTLALALAGCAPPGAGMGGLMAGGGGGGMPDQNRMMKQQELMQKLMNDPQVPAWYTQREKITLATGDRVFDKEFERVFDSLTIALASMEANVNNMERSSGYITTGLPRLNPERAEQLKKAKLVDYCKHNGYDPSLLEKKSPYEMDVDAFSGISMKQQAMTISLVRQSPTQTKVKIRFSNVNYPPELQEYYKVVWPAIDKQIFLDRAID